MPAWWGKKSTKNKDPQSKDKERDKYVKPRSFDELLCRNSPRSSKDFGGSVSSTSSSGSSDSGPVNTDQAQLDTFRGLGDNRLSPLSRSPVRSRGTTTTSSPLHPRFASINLDSPTGKLDDVRSSTINMSKWKKGRLLGRGTFGHVYLGFNRENGQMCAIKEVKVVSDDQTSRECLKQLNQNMSTREPVIQNYTRQILSGLSFLHARNTVHRDIKRSQYTSGSLMVKSKLADFGMAKHITSCSSVLSFKGSPYWMAPEVVMNTSGYGLAVDIWSRMCKFLKWQLQSHLGASIMKGVAAIFKIGNSKDFPEIPEHLSNDAKSFIRLCLQREPSTRPTASQLLEHPFVKNQEITAKSCSCWCNQRYILVPLVEAGHANYQLNHCGLPYCALPNPGRPFSVPVRSLSNHLLNPTIANKISSEVRRPVLELHFNGRNISPGRNILPPEGNYASHPVITVSRPLICARKIKTITSLPVSPTSSPLRQYEPARKSCYLSPPHPSYGMGGQSGYDANDYSMFQARPNSRTTLDPWLEIPQLRSQTPSRSPKTRPIL
ncbi:hypothetical protein HAX54_032057 [Datura stramonium]|uniref:mitogen-activated protein kinase kinase kinase n=1 Tax=Datura stramonium TaxID=4076 RepID=A0ABS8VDD3_DATST|nr:hypothetical protein [Datura stramonium]